MSIVDLLVRTGLAPSKNEARKLIDGRGIRLNDEEVTDVRRIVTDADLGDGGALLRKGRKTFHRVVPAGR